MNQTPNGAQTGRKMCTAWNLRIVICIALVGLAAAGCIPTKTSQDEAQVCTRSVARAEAPPDMDHLCGLIRSYDTVEGETESLEYITKYSRCDETAEKNRNRLRSLCYAWRANSPAPEITDIEKGGKTFPWTDACEIATGSKNNELGMAAATEDPAYDQYRKYLKTALDVEHPADQQDLICYFAILDRDKDQVPDYTVSDHGRFVQNDVDVDEDGVRNVRDANPVNPAVAEPKSCGQGAFPKGAKLSCDNGNDEACELQEKLYNEFDVVVVNRELTDTDPRILASLRVIYDVMNLIFSQGMLELEQAQGDCPGKPTLPSFKTVSFENCPHDTLNIDSNYEQECQQDASTTGAEAIAHNATFVVVPFGADSPSLIRLGTYVHELGHLFSFALDYDDEKYANLVRRNYWQSVGLKEMLDPLGWSIDYRKKGERPNNVYEHRNVLNVQDHVLFDEGSYKWKGFEVTELRNKIECGVDKPEGCTEEEKYEFGDKHVGYLAAADEFDRTNNALFTWYGAGDPWEWYAEAVMAYLYRAMSEHIATRSDSVVLGNTRVLLRTRVLENYSGNEFYFENMSDDLFEEHKKLFPINSEQLDELVCRYIVNSDDVLFGGDWKLTPQFFEAKGSEVGYSDLTEKLEPEDLQLRLAAAWEPVCDRLDHLKQAIIN